MVIKPPDRYLPSLVVVLMAGDCVKEYSFVLKERMLACLVSWIFAMSSFNLANCISMKFLDDTNHLPLQFQVQVMRLFFPAFSLQAVGEFLRGAVAVGEPPSPFPRILKIMRSVSTMVSIVASRWRTCPSSIT